MSEHQPEGQKTGVRHVDGDGGCGEFFPVLKALGCVAA